MNKRQRKKAFRIKYWEEYYRKRKRVKWRRSNIMFWADIRKLQKELAIKFDGSGL